MNEHIKREESVHGRKWGVLHGGYFSDPAIAAPLVRKILEFAGKSNADTVVDLGGGTGYLLSRLLACGMGHGVSLINLDDSDKQLDSARETGISCVRAAVDKFSRRDLGTEDGRFLFMMRSVLHYFGKDGLAPTLRHLRFQARSGEFFIHQTASFKHSQDAGCLNSLYRLMRTQKWYPTVELMKNCLKSQGWQVLEVLPAPILPLSSSDLMERYGIDRKDMIEIGMQLSRDHHVEADVFGKEGDDFCAFLHYWIYVCAPF